MRDPGRAPSLRLSSARQIDASDGGLSDVQVQLKWRGTGTTTAQGIGVRSPIPIIATGRTIAPTNDNSNGEN